MTGQIAFAVVRAVHELAALIALGQLVWAQVVGRPPDARARTLVAGSIAVSLVAGLGWLAFVAADMSGLPLVEALSRSVLTVVLEKTLFGGVWSLRLALGFALCVWIALRGCAAREPQRRETRMWLILVGVYVATLALTGHAVAAQGAQRVLRVAADAIHLIAAGSWLGALPGLAFAAAAAKRSGEASAMEAAARATRRFSVLGVLSVGALIVTGTVNAWYLVASWLALVGTPYGQWLLAKLVVFAAMVAIAAYNRERLSPRIRAGERLAVGLLARNARIELGLGVVVVGIVGHLGISVPAAHDRVVMPSQLASHVSSETFPMTDAVPPVPASDDVIARGRELFVANCATCHGESGRGDGPAAATLPMAPADLTMHGSMHTPGDLWWMIAHGVPGTPMPAFSPRLSNISIWKIVRYLRALAGANDARGGPPSPTHAHPH